MYRSVLAILATMSSGALEAQVANFANPSPGVCLLARSVVLGQSRNGQLGTQRMQQLNVTIANELAPQRQALLQEQQAMQADRAAPSAQMRQRQAAFEQRAQRFSQLEQLRNAQLIRTKQLVEQSIANYIDPALAPVIAAHRCSVVFERGAAYGWNGAMDLTPQAVQEVDKRMPPMTINLVDPQSLGQR